VDGGGLSNFDKALENRIEKWCVTWDKRRMLKWSYRIGKKAKSLA